MIVRSWPEERDKVFLTFDDGPDAHTTPLVLDLLERKNARATFFVIAQKIASGRALVRRMQAEGHSLGDHSLDHRYSNFLLRDESLRKWLRASRETLEGEGVADFVGFRPPAGVVTPPLKRVAESMRLPLILWNERFYDAVFPWSEGRARKSAARLSGGSIVLLHDRQSPTRGAEFVRVLEIYIDRLQARGFQLAALPRLKPVVKSSPVSLCCTPRPEVLLL